MLAIIGGSGLTRLSTLAVARREVVRTPYGEPSSALVFGQIAGCEAPVGIEIEKAANLGHPIPSIDEAPGDCVAKCTVCSGYDHIHALRPHDDF